MGHTQTKSSDSFSNGSPSQGNGGCSDNDNKGRLLWLDEQLQIDSNQRTKGRLLELDKNLKTFTNESRCLSYIRESHNQMFLIVSGKRCQTFIPQIHNMPEIIAIYIFCLNKQYYEEWSKNYSKIKQIFTSTEDMVEKLQVDLSQQNDANEVDDLTLSYFGSTDDRSTEDNNATLSQRSFRNLDRDEKIFLWYYLLADIISKVDDNERLAKQDFIDACRKQCIDDEEQLELIEDFKNDKTQPFNAIGWYTRHCFVFKCVNATLRTENISNLYTYRYFIRILIQQLIDEHKSFTRKMRKEKIKSLTVYRGQHLTKESIEQLQTLVGSLISLNGFISTSKNERQAISFSRSRNDSFRHEPVIFIITIDLTLQTKPYADISHLSGLPENEILFTIGTVFRLNKIEYVRKEKRWRIELSLSSDGEQTVNKYIENTYMRNVDEKNPQVTFGKVLIEMNQIDNALTYFKSLMSDIYASENDRLGTYQNNIGICYQEKRQLDKALEHYQNALDYYQSTQNKQGLATCYHNIASVYQKQKDYKRAIKYYLRATRLPQHDVERATTFTNLGCAHLKAADNVDAALDYFEDGLRIRQRWLCRNHPDLANSFVNIAETYLHQRNNESALEYYERALTIFEQIYPSDQKDVIQTNNCISQLRTAMNRE